MRGLLLQALDALILKTIDLVSVPRTHSCVVTHGAIGWRMTPMLVAISKKQRTAVQRVHAHTRVSVGSMRVVSRWGGRPEASEWGVLRLTGSGGGGQVRGDLRGGTKSRGMCHAGANWSDARAGEGQPHGELLSGYVT